MINTKAVIIVRGFCVVFCKRGIWLQVFKCGEPPGECLPVLRLLTLGVFRGLRAAAF